MVDQENETKEYRVRDIDFSNVLMVDAVEVA